MSNNPIKPNDAEKNSLAHQEFNAKNYLEIGLG